MSAPVVAVWQQALAAEQAAVHGYGIVGPRVPPDERSPARRCEQEHRELRDQTSAGLLTAGEAPVAPEASYPLPFPVVDTVSARRLAVRLETDAAAAWRYLIAVSAPGEAARKAAAPALTASALRAMRWRRLLTPQTPTVPFPGL